MHTVFIPRAYGWSPTYINQRTQNNLDLRNAYEPYVSVQLSEQRPGDAVTERNDHNSGEGDRI
jgi:hypothetical protein